MEYINIKKLINSILREIKKELEKNLNEEQIHQLLSKYQANDIFDLLEIMVCQSSRNCINLNYKDFIDEINKELYETSFSNEVLTKRNNELEYLQKRYKEELINLAKLVEKYKTVQNELEEKFSRLDISKPNKKPLPFIGSDFKI